MRSVAYKTILDNSRDGSGCVLCAIVQIQFAGTDLLPDKFLTPGRFFRRLRNTVNGWHRPVHREHAFPRTALKKM
jgi:hypothetical protein